MGTMEDPFESFVVEETADDFAALARRPVSQPQPPVLALAAGTCTARFHGFDLEDRPLVSGLPQVPGEVLLARTTVPLLRETVGAEVVVICDQGDPRCPIVIGVLQERSFVPVGADMQRQLVSVQADEDRYVISAEREIVLRCGDASITLTRAGKVIIEGNYILSRSTGYNKIKGAAVDIN
jgi:hypothetical protein